MARRIVHLPAGGQLAVQQVLPVAVDVLPVVGRLAGEWDVREGWGGARGLLVPDFKPWHRGDGRLY